MTVFVPRSDWGARKSRGATQARLGDATAHYGGDSPWGAAADRSSPERFALTTDHARCPAIVRAYQAWHMDRQGWTDLAYTSCVCPHDHVYEGRGPGVRTAANGTTAGNASSHAVCYIAGVGDPLTPGAMRAFLHEHVRLGGLNHCHRDWKSTACPGDPTCSWVRAGRPHPGGPTPPLPTPSPTRPTEDDDMPARIAQVPGRPEWLCVDHRYFHHIESPAAAGVLLWFGQATLQGDKPYALTMAQLRATYTIAPGHDDPFTRGVDESKAFGLDAELTLPDGRRVTLGAVVAEVAATTNRTELRVIGAGQQVEALADKLDQDPPEG